METRQPVLESELHAYVDGALTPDDAARIQAWLSDNAEDADRVRSWRDDTAMLRAAYADVAVPGAARAALGGSRRRIGWAVAAGIAAVAFGLGGGAGVLATRQLTPQAVAPAWAQAGVSAHKVYVSEVRHPVEVAAAERDHLVQWLSNRLGATIDPPDLSQRGLTLLGGRLLPQDGAPAAMLMYEDDTGNRVSLLVLRREGAGETAFRIWEDDGVAAVYWIDASLGYILSGDADRARLIDIAHAIHQALT